MQRYALFLLFKAFSLRFIYVWETFALTRWKCSDCGRKFFWLFLSGIQWAGLSYHIRDLRAFKKRLLMRSLGPEVSK